MRPPETTLTSTSPEPAPRRASHLVMIASLVAGLRLGPALVVALGLVLYTAYALTTNQGDVGEMARLGQQRREGNTAGLEGYDGQYVYLIALNPDPAWAARQPPDVIDTPAYRYQRILLPLLARLLAFGQPALVPWAIIGLSLLAQVVGTFLVGELLSAYGVSRWYALVYGLWVGFVYAVRLALTEPLAYALVAAALLSSRRGRERWAALLYGLALFAKEVTFLFVVAHLVWLAAQRDWRSVVRLASIALLPFIIFQFVILYVFGRFGLGSGGYLGTPFEIIPYMGLWRIGEVSLPALALFSVLFVPLAVLPSLWGIVEPLRRLWKGEWTLPVLALGANAAFLPFTPHSTFREPLGMIRLLCGLVLAVLIFGAYARSRRVLNYSVFWLAALVMLVNEAR